MGAKPPELTSHSQIKETEGELHKTSLKTNSLAFLYKTFRTTLCGPKHLKYC